FGHRRGCQAVDLPSPKGDTNAPLRLSRFGRRNLSPIVRVTTHPLRSCHGDEFGHVTAMNNAEFQLRGVGDPRLAVHATSALPAWLWSTDGARIMWANPVGAKQFGAANGAVLAKKLFGPADAHR